MSYLWPSPKSPDASDLVESSSSDKDKQSVKIVLQHFSHEYLFVYEHAHLFGTLREFLVDKSCVEPPRYIHTSLHPMHSLELYWSQILFGESPYCRFCKLQVDSFGYKCRSSTTTTTTTVCDFYLHIECATENTLDPKDHEHSFVNLKPTFFTCDGCGIDEDTKYCSSICSICQLQVHLTCRQSFPLSGRVRQRMHGHELKLCYSFEFDFDYSNKFCKICSKKMNNVFCLYQCNKGCAYIAHVSCATSKDYWLKNIDHEEEEEVELEEIDTEPPEEVITHFSHPHSLILSNIEPTYEAGCVCYGCVRPISAPFYTCSEKCKFFLHKRCSQLPKTIQSPLHIHPLEFQEYLDFDKSDVFFRGFTCDACRVRCNGFAYKCQNYCGKIFDAGCAFLGDTLNHPSHKCTLTLLSTIPNEGKRCIACDSTFSTAFWCDECNFFLDLKCASLPKTIGHNCPTGTIRTVKPLKLTYVCIEHTGGQYYCYLCRETRGKDLWFYHCEDCRKSIHPQCIVGDDRFMYGKFYNIDGHCHIVCVAKKPKFNYPLCDTCGIPCLRSPLVFCPTCKVYFHDDLKCCGIVVSYLYDDLKCCGMVASSSYKTIKSYYCWIPSSPNDDDDDDDDDEEEEAETVVEQLHHFSHPHNLIIGEYDPERLDEEVCDGCGMQITDPFYRCDDKKGKCNFFLHRECFELPKQIQHSLHPDHPLVLNSFMDLPCNDEVAIICYGCNACSNRFVYTCLACKFFIDVRCSLLSDTLVHESHPHKLTLIDKKKELAKGERKCEACNSDCSSCKYICDECNFELGLRCVSLPELVKHFYCDYDGGMLRKHLMYGSAIDDGSRNYDCDMCEESVGEKEWYYYCKDCGEATHVACSDAARRTLLRVG